MKTILALILVSFSYLAFSYDSTKLHIRLKITDPTMVPLHPDSTDCPNTAFQNWMVQNKVTHLVKVFSSQYDSIGELKYRFRIFHDSNAFVLASALDSMAGIKEVFIYDFQASHFEFPVCTTSYITNDPNTSMGDDLTSVPNFLPNQDYDRFAYLDDFVDLTSHLDVIEAECAWAITHGDPNIVIGIVDSWIDTGHEDLSGKFVVWEHWNDETLDPILESFRPIIGNIGDNIVPENWYTKNRTMSTFYHGTMCCGAAATNFNNSKGISGIGGDCRLAGYSFLGYGPTQPDHIPGWTDLDEAVMMAIEDNVKVINCSWGPALGEKYYYKDDAQIIRTKNRAGFLLKEIVEYGISKGIVFTMAGGNEFKFEGDYQTFPIEQFVLAEGAIIVGGSYNHGPNNSSNLDRLFPEFNHAEYIDVCAPLNIASTKLQYNPAHPGLASFQGDNKLQNEFYTFGYGFGGTSSSSALVAGIVGLMFSVNPDLSPAAVECLLKAGCEPMDNLGYENGQVVTIPSNHLGAGRVNAYNAVYLAKGDGGNLSGTVVWDKIHHVSSNLTLLSGCTLTISYRTLISPIRKIIVNPGAKLIIDGATLTNLCGDGPWGGIVVLGDYTKTQLPEDQQGVVELKNGALIENAIEGVRAIGYQNNGIIDITTARGIIKATQSQFKNNQTDVVIFGLTKIANVNRPNQSYFKDCSFITDGENKISNLKEHIRLTNCLGILFEGCIFTDNRNVVPMVDGRTGIEAINATFSINDYINGGTTTHSTFIDLKRAISAVGNPSDSKIYINKAEFSCYTGVYLSATNNARVVDNIFNVEKKPSLYHFNINPFGLYLNNSNAFDLEYNKFNGTNSASGYGFNSGLVIRNSGSRHNEFYRCEFENFTVASEAIEHNMDPTDPGAGLKFRCNDYAEDNQDFLIVPDFWFSDKTITGIANLQGYRLKPADNRFDITHALWNINNDVDYGVDYFHRDIISPDRFIPEDDRIVNTKLHIADVGGTTGDCPDKLDKGGPCNPCFFRVPIVDYRNEMNTNNSLWNTATDNGNTKTLINEIINVNPGTAIALYNSLMSYSPWLSLRTLAKVAEMEIDFSEAQIKNILMANPHAGRSKWIVNILSNKNTPMSTSNIDDIISSGNTNTVRDTLYWDVSYSRTKYDLMLNDLITYYLEDTIEHIATLDSFLRHPTSPSYRYQLAKIYFDRNLYSQYNAVIDSIPTQIYLNEDEENYHTVFKDFYFQIKEWKLDSVPLPILDSSQTAWLTDFYSTNPNIPTYGHSLLALNDTTYINFDSVYITDTTYYVSSGPNNSAGIISISKASKEIIISPNPTDNEITLTWKNYSKTEKDISVEIIDITGKIVLNKIWDFDLQSLDIDLSSMKSGIYYCSVLRNNRVFEVHKIILER